MPLFVSCWLFSRKVSNKQSKLEAGVLSWALCELSESLKVIVHGYIQTCLGANSTAILSHKSTQMSCKSAKPYIFSALGIESSSVNIWSSNGAPPDLYWDLYTFWPVVWPSGLKHSLTDSCQSHAKSWEMVDLNPTSVCALWDFSWVFPHTFQTNVGPVPLEIRPGCTLILVSFPFLLCCHHPFTSVCWSQPQLLCSI